MSHLEKPEQQPTKNSLWITWWEWIQLQVHISATKQYQPWWKQKRGRQHYLSSPEDVSEPHGHSQLQTPPEAHPWVPGQSDILILSMTHKIGTRQTFADNKKDKNHISWGSARLLFHPIKSLELLKVKRISSGKRTFPSQKVSRKVEEQ